LPSHYYVFYSKYVFWDFILLRDILKKIIAYLLLAFVASIYQDCDAKPTSDAAWSYYQKGITLYNQGNNIAAIKEFTRAIESGEQLSDTNLIAFSLHHIARINDWQTDYNQAIKNQQKAQILFKTVNNIDYWAVSNIHIGELFDKLGLSDSTLHYYKLNLGNENQISDCQILSDTYKNIAEHYLQKKNYKKAYQSLTEGIHLAEEMNDSLFQANLYFVTGKLFLDTGLQTNISLDYFINARELYSKTNRYWDERKTELFIADAQLKLGNDSIALEYYEKITSLENTNQHWLISLAYHKKGMYYKNAMQYNLALINFKKSISKMCNVCPEIAIHNTFLETADTYLKLNQADSTFTILQRALEIAENSNSQYEIIESCIALGNAYLYVNNYKLAEAYHLRANKVAVQKELYDKIEISSSALFNIYQSINNHKNAAEYLKMAYDANKELAKNNKINENSRLELKLEIEAQQKVHKETQLAFEKQLLKQKVISSSLVIGILFLMLTGIVLWLAFRNKRKTNKKLIVQNNEIEKMAKQITVFSRMKTNYFTNISHEIRTPLTLIKANIEQALKNNESEHNYRNKLNIALKNTNNLKELFNQLLDLEKLQEKHFELAYTNFDSIELCRSLTESFSDYLKQRNCTLELNSNATSANIEFDEIRFKSIISNLLSNAIKFNKNSGKVIVNIEIQKTGIYIEVSDTGIGITEDKLPLIGTKYYRIQSGNDYREGTGIGISYVKEILELVNGEFEIHSKPNIGTKVEIRIPLKFVEITNYSSLNYNVAYVSEANTENLIHKENKNEILIIEDNSELQTFLVELFKTEFNVSIASNGKEGVEVALKNIPDIIISDIMMPELKGDQLCKELKSNVKTSHVPILLLTAKGNYDSINNGYDCGADDYIVKPFDSELLFKKVSNIMNTRNKLHSEFGLLSNNTFSQKFSDLDKEFLDKCIAIINENIDNSVFSVEEFANILCMNSKTFTRKLKALIGISPSEFIKKNRMDSAKQLLDKKYRVSEVALMVGYEDTRRFSEAFKKQVGILPSKYLNN